MAEVLHGSIDLDKAISRVHDNLDVLPAGKGGKPSRNLYGTEKLEVLFASLRGAYDVIIMDAPLAHPAANVAMLSRFADITLMVVRQGSVGYAGVAEAIENLNKFGADV
ncbi:hypothetical protein KZW06_30090, partial [Klebsiella pneumoniae]|nr:hypothetical protein [Klebsiella pneumoniae]